VNSSFVTQEKIKFLVEKSQCSHVKCSIEVTERSPFTPFSFHAPLKFFLLCLTCFLYICWILLLAFCHLWNSLQEF